MKKGRRAQKQTHNHTLLIVGLAAALTAVGYFVVPGLADAVKNSRGGGGGTTVTPLPGAGQPHSMQLSNGPEKTAQYLFAQSPVNLDIRGPITIEAWVKVKTEAFGWPSVAILTSPRDIGFQTPPYWLFVNDGEPCGQFAQDEAGYKGGRAFQTCAQGSFMVPDTWYHVAVTSDPEKREMYINGTRVRHDIGGPSAIRNKGNNNFYVGGPDLTGLCGAGCGVFNGQIDELRVWNRARTGEEIASDYNKELTGSESGLLGYWKFNAELVGGKVKDSSPSGNHLQLVNKPQFSTDAPF